MDETLLDRGVSRELEQGITRRLGRASATLAAVAVLATWPLDVCSFGHGAPAVAGLARTRVIGLGILVAGAVLLRASGSLRHIHALWLALYLTLTTAVFASLGTAFPSDAAIVHAALLVPFATVVFVAPFALRLAAVGAGAACALAAWEVAQPGTWLATRHALLVADFLVAASGFAVWLGHRLRGLFLADGLRRHRIEGIATRQQALLVPVARDLAVPLAGMRGLVAGLSRENTHAGIALRVEELDALVVVIEEVVAQVLTYVRARDAVEPETERFAAREVLARPLDEWRTIRESVEVSLIDDGPPVRIRAHRRDLVGALGAVVHRAIRLAAHDVQVRVEPVRDGLLWVAVEHDGRVDPRERRAGLEELLAVAKRALARSGGCLEIGAPATSGGRVKLGWPVASPRAMARETPRRVGLLQSASHALARLDAQVAQELEPASGAARDFEREAERLALALGERLCAFLCVLQLVAWPTDRYVFGTDSAVTASLAEWRTLTLLVLAAGWCAARLHRRRALHPYLLWTAFHAGLGGLTGRMIGSTFPPASPVPYALCWIPFASVVMVAPLGVRVAVSMVVTAAIYAGYAFARIATGTAVGAPVGAALFAAAAASVWIGRWIGELFAEGHRRSAALDAAITGQRQLLQALAHEIRTPLARIRFVLDYVAEQGRPGSLAGQTDELASCVAQLDELSQEVGTYVRYGEPVEGSAESFELRQAVAGSVREWTAVPCAVALHGFEDAPALRLRGNTRDFVRAIANLVRNAQRFARREVSLSFIELPDGRLEIAVADDGPGIPPHERDRVFQPFVRLDPARTSESGGLGLGLAIARRIVERHGGTIRIDGPPGGGTRVVTTWIISVAPATPATP